ncbi:MAG: iron-containing alcohol dehydrogenase [bacterium]|nr:iron-containing alcohol dehydrogenase [bacterium]
MVIPSFNFASIPGIRFGAGTFNTLGKTAKSIGSSALIITGGSSLQSSGKADILFRQLEDAGISYASESVKGEPSPELIDGIVSQYKDTGIDLVIGVGGGSVLDAGKAVSAMLTCDGSVCDYLEGVGTVAPPGTKLPFIAVPTTSGTGSEATKNAVISSVGEKGFKKSLRHDKYVPDIAIVDPVLTLSAPARVTASCGMDAFSQLLESYVSTKANPMTDALALSGICFVAESLVPLCTSEPGNIEKRANLAYASLISGITLANAGLGVIHGIAGTIGGMFPVPHGIACGTLLGESIRVTIKRLKENRETGAPYLNKFADVGQLIGSGTNQNIDYCCDVLVHTILEWTETLKIPRLGEYGITGEDAKKIAAESGNKNNPVQLSVEDMEMIVKSRVKRELRIVKG